MNQVIFKEDYQREISRKYVCFSLIYALKAILNTNIDYKTYYQIPENKKQLCDIKIINIKIKKDYSFERNNIFYYVQGKIKFKR